MAKLLLMPSLSPTMETGVISQWNKKEGDFIEVGEVLAEVETDKAVMDFEMVDEGFVAKYLVEPGVELAVGMPIAILAESKDEDISTVLAEAKAIKPPANGGGAPEEGAEAPAPPAAPQAMPAQAAPAPVAPPPPAAVAPAKPVAPAPSNGEPVRISPYARKLADSLGVDYRQLAGSGPGGRIVARDVEGAPKGAAQPVGGQPPAAARGIPAVPAPAPARPGESYQDFPLSMMRKAIARKMVESKQTVPHFQATRKIRAEAMLAARERMNADFPGENKISVNDLIVKASAAALRLHPTVNSQFLDDRIRQFYMVDISVAVATDEGLLTPVLRGVEWLGLREISTRMRELAGRARDKRLAPEEYSGGTFTISNMGMFGVNEFNGIINTPQACLLAVSTVVDEPVVENGQVVAGRTMNLTLSSDHRVVDGATAAQFLDSLARMLENPVAMLL